MIKVLVAKHCDLMLSRLVAERMGWATNCDIDNLGISVWSASNEAACSKQGNEDKFDWLHSKEFRTDPVLIQCVEELGIRASGYHDLGTGELMDLLRIVEVQDDLNFKITIDWRDARCEEIQEFRHRWMVNEKTGEYVEIFDAVTKT